MAPIEPIKKRTRAPKASNLPIVVKSRHKIVSNKQEFIIGKQIGEGGFARIYDGHEVNTKEDVAIKMEPLTNGPLSLLFPSPFPLPSRPLRRRCPGWSRGCRRDGSGGDG